MLKVMPGWELDVERGPDCLLVRVRKPRRRSRSLAPLDDALWSVLDQHFIYRLVLDLDQVETLGEETLEQLLGLCERISARGGMLRICGLDPQGREALRRLDDRLVVYQDPADVVIGSGAPRRPR